MRQFGLIGYPLGHSFSKKYFTDKFERENITGCSYELFPIPDIAQFPALLEAIPLLKGLNVTIPYKQQVIPFLSSIDNLPEGLNACNCISIDNGKLIGNNTDVTGFEKNFITQLRPNHTKALVLGNGGAAAAIVFVLKKLGIDFLIVSRQLQKGSHITYDDVSPRLLSEFSVVINTTPLGTFPNADQFPALPYEAIGTDHYLFDLVYNPAKTLFLQKGEERGAAIQNGYNMLVQQAEDSWTIWNG